MVRITWLESAQSDLYDIFEFISLDSKKFAQLQIERILGRTEILKSQPMAGRTVP